MMTALGADPRPLLREQGRGALRPGLLQKLRRREHSSRPRLVAPPPGRGGVGARRCSRAEQQKKELAECIEKVLSRNPVPVPAT